MNTSFLKREKVQRLLYIGLHFCNENLLEIGPQELGIIDKEGYSFMRKLMNLWCWTVQDLNCACGFMNPNTNNGLTLHSVYGTYIRGWLQTRKAGWEQWISAWLLSRLYCYLFGEPEPNALGSSQQFLKSQGRNWKGNPICDASTGLASMRTWSLIFRLPPLNTQKLDMVACPLDIPEPGNRDRWISKPVDQPA